MHIRNHIAVLALASVLMLALVIADASARSFSVTERNFERIWNNALSGKTKLSFRDSGGHNIECNITMLGRYSANTITKRTEINQGTINHGEVEGCTGGSLTLKAETMPWNMRYLGFTGRLPAIESISTGIVNAQWKMEEAGLLCNAGSEVNHPLGFITEGSGLENIRADETRTIPLTGEFGLCNFVSPESYAGRGLILNLPRNANITITLI